MDIAPKEVDTPKDIAVVTLAVGQQSYWSLAIATHRDYANRIGARHVIIDELDPEIGQEVKLQKFQIFRLLDEFSRLLYLDADMIVSAVCPDLFSIVPIDRIGVVAEAPPWFERREVFLEACQFYSCPSPPPDQLWFNSGMIVLSREHRNLFLPPRRIKAFRARNRDGTIAPPRFSWLDMPLLNARVVSLRIPVFYLDYRFNFLQPLSEVLTGEDGPEKAFIFHACGEDKDALQTIHASWERIAGNAP